MPRRACLLAVCIAAVTALESISAAPPAARTSRASEVRGLWVLRTSLVSRDQIATMVRAAESGGFNTLLVQVRGRGEAFYRSDIEPRASDLDRQPAAFDPLATVIESAHAAGLKVHAWVNVNLVASGTTLPRARDHVALQHPDWLMAPRTLAGQLRKIPPRSPAYVGTLSRWTRGASDQVEGLYLSPILPAARKHTESVVRELVSRYAIDGLHLDYIRFPNDEFDYSPAALAEFRSAQLRRVKASDAARIDRLAETDATAWPTALGAEWAAFRRERLTSLVEQVTTAARRARSGLIVSAAVIPSPEEARGVRLQDWRGWAAAGLLDVVCPMIYTTDASEFGATVAELAADLQSTPFWAGIGAYKLPLAGTIEHVRLARQRGADGILLFSYDKPTDTGTVPGGFAALRPVLLDAAHGSTPKRP